MKKFKKEELLPDLEIGKTTSANRKANQLNGWRKKYLEKNKIKTLLECKRWVMILPYHHLGLSWVNMVNRKPAPKMNNCSLIFKSCTIRHPRKQ